MSKPFVSMIDRFNDLYSPEPNTGCWIWLGYLRGIGYGLIASDPDSDSKVRRLSAHRASYQMFRGPIPEGLEIDHKCKMPCCVNPQHLEAVPPLVNKERSDSPATINAKKKFCKNGHSLDDPSVYTWNGRKRLCRICRAAYCRRYNQDRKLLQAP
jgi:hypothetical protein